MARKFDDAQEAIVHGDLEELKSWLRQGGELNATNDIGEGLMHKAAYNGQIEIAEYLMRQGVSLLARDNQSFTPLHEAARNRQPEMVEWLLERGAVPTAKTKDGKTPYDLAKGEEGADAKRAQAILQNATSKPLWQKVSDEEIICVTPKLLIGRTLTEIFNFGARTYLLVTANDDTKAESTVFRTFSDFTDTQVIERAEAEFKRLGGKLPEGYGGLNKPKARLPGRGLG